MSAGVMEKAKVSVVIPAYNAEATIAAAIESAQSQSFAPCEIIVVNDGSTDGTQGIVQALAAEAEARAQAQAGGGETSGSGADGNPQSESAPSAPPRSAAQIKLINVKNGGVSRARNFGIKAARGNFIAFLDSDDAWHAQKLEKQIQAFRDYPSAVLVSTSSTVKKSFSQKTRRVSFTHLLMRNHIITSSAMVKADAAKAALFDESLRRAEDYNLWLRLARTGAVVFIDEKLVYFAPKRTFGVAGLSGNFHALTFDELRGFTRLLKRGTINFAQFVFACSMTCAKYLRKCIIAYLT